MLKTAASFNRYGAALKDAGLRFAYHNYSHDFTAADSPTTPGENFYDVLMAATEPGLVGFELDVFWVAWSGAKASDIIGRNETSWAVNFADRGGKIARRMGCHLCLAHFS